MMHFYCLSVSGREGAAGIIISISLRVGIVHNMVVSLAEESTSAYPGAVAALSTGRQKGTNHTHALRNIILRSSDHI